MSDTCVHEVTIAASPEKVFGALTQQDELARWLTKDAIAEPTVGSVAEFRFGDGVVVMELEIALLEIGKSVAWRVRHGQPETIDTLITWDLAPVNNGTRLLLGHHRFSAADASLEPTPDAWAYYLGSLQSYLETGKGTPNALFG
ncbi:MAG: SRPBCC family protein [Ktedonobacterales bacterium]